MTELIIAEKNDAARRIADILSTGDMRRTQTNGVAVYTWADRRCIGLAGHVVEIDFSEAYSSWTECDPAELVDAEVVTRPSKVDIVNALTNEAGHTDTVVIATDYDREGELIGREASELITDIAPNMPVKRVRFSSLTPTAVFTAFEDCADIDHNLADAAQSRQSIDLRWGASLTRYFTLATEDYSDVISLGRVQTPTLKLLVDREREIEAFEPESFWTITATAESPDTQQRFEATFYYHDNKPTERIWRETVAREIGTTISNTNRGTVTNVDAYTRTDHPPSPFNTTAFIQAAGAIGVNATPAMSIAEELYTAGHITYPRTENTVYPDDVDIDGILSSIDTATPFSDAVSRVRARGDRFPTRGETESTDHPPIHPTSEPPSKSQLSKREWRIYQLVTRRFLATLAEPAVWAHRRLDIAVGSYALKATGKAFEDRGYHAVYPYFDTASNTVPRVPEGAVVAIARADVDQSQTRPPNRYGHSGLVSKMKSAGLGTKSTRHTHIDKLYERDYVEGDPPRPTAVARAVVDAAETYAEQIVTPAMTADLESRMTAITEGETTATTVRDASRRRLRSVFERLDGDGVQSAVGTRLSKAREHDADDSEEAAPEPIGECQACGGELLIRETTSGDFVGCREYPDCENSFNLPEKGRVHLLDTYCEDHGMHHVKMIAGSYTFVYGCPGCQAEQDTRNGDARLGACPECSLAHGGQLAIKRVPTGSRLVGCDRYPDCEYSLPLPRTGNIEITDTLCDDHELPALDVIQDEDDEPWHLGCPVCNYQEYANS
ncbi:MAG: Topoisomerase IA [halophilic archaeon J07HX5]|nr:MAG: Topoisomerase IA [halophilic archaeon J07HX5]